MHWCYLHKSIFWYVCTLISKCPNIKFQLIANLGKERTCAAHPRPRWENTNRSPWSQKDRTPTIVMLPKKSRSTSPPKSSPPPWSPLLELPTLELLQDKMANSLGRWKASFSWCFFFKKTTLRWKVKRLTLSWAPTPLASTSSRLWAPPSRCCDDLNVYSAHRRFKIYIKLQDFPTEVKEECLRRAFLFMQVHTYIWRLESFFVLSLIIRRQRREPAAIISERPTARSRRSSYIELSAILSTRLPFLVQIQDLHNMLALLAWYHPPSIFMLPSFRWWIK